MIVYTAGGFMKNSNSFELLIAHDKKIGEAYKKLCMDLINNDFEQSKVSCKNILELIKIETSMLDKMTKEELEYYVDLADIIFTMDEVDDETYRASEKIVQTYMAKFEKPLEYDFSDEEEDFEKLSRIIPDFAFTQEELDRYFQYNQTYKYNAMCYASKIILNDELCIKSNNSKFYDLLRKKCIHNLIYYAYHSYEVECYILSHNMQMDYVPEIYDDYFNPLNVEECKKIISKWKDASDNQNPDCCFTNLEDTYKLKCYLHSLERTELTNIFDYILHLKEEHSSKMLDYYENIVLEKIDDLSR